MSGSVLPTVCLTDFTQTFSPEELKDVGLALQLQISEHFQLPPPFGWGLPCMVRVSQLPMPHEWVLGLYKDPDQAGALGYHDETPTGQPLAKIFPFLDKTQPWSVTASHELVETLADPLLCRAAQARDGKFWALETADAVEQDVYEIAIPSGKKVAVSNFVLPTYFEPPRRVAYKLDHMGLIKHPYEIRPGGYGQWFDPGKGWQMVQADRRSAYREAVSGRAARRKNAYEPDTFPLKADGWTPPNDPK